MIHDEGRGFFQPPPVFQLEKNITSVNYHIQKKKNEKVIRLEIMSSTNLFLRKCIHTIIVPNFEIYFQYEHEFLTS